VIYLVDGISFAVMAMGVFGVAEILYNILRPDGTPDRPTEISSLYPTRKEYRDSAAPAVRGTVLGTVLGLLPGGGATLSSFLSYAVEKRLSSRPERFGQGEIAGVAGPEAANNASAQSQFLPTLMLGIPVTPIMALMVAVLIINGIQPGPTVIANNPALFWGLIASMWIGNAILVILNIPLVRIWVAVLQTPRWLLYPGVILISVIGAHSINNSWFDVALLAVFGIMGLALRMAKFDPTPMALAFIVAPMFEEYFRRALTISRGDWMIFIERPISLAFVMLASSAVIASVIWRKNER
jgi:putative tricarboxylic transport membrane protein